MNKLRKALIVSVMFVTVLSMSVVVAPEADAAVAGDLIKMDGLSSIYYLGADNKRYVFPNETTYFSWYDDFSSVVTVSQSELESYSLGANVTMRAGTNLVKITTDPKVYAVEPNGVLRWITDEGVAKTLYGDNWAQRVVDVADAFFTNYTISATNVTETAYPAGSLVKFGEDATVYYINADGTASAVNDEAAFTANRFSWDDVITATIATPDTGDAITDADSTIIDTSQGGGAGTGIEAGAGTGLSAAISADTATAANLPSNAALVPFITVNLTASNDGDVTVTNMTFVRTGTGATTDFDGGYLYEGDTRLTNKKTVNSTSHEITFSAVGLTIPAGTTKQITLKMSAASTGTQSGNHAFELQSDGVVTNGAAVSGSFPIAGNLMSYSASAAAANLTLTASNNSYTRYVGETDVILGEFDINNSTSNEDVNIYRIKLKQDGDAGNDSVGNMSLEIDGTIVATGVSMVDKYVDFMLDTPYLLKKSKRVTATIRGDVLTDVTKTVELYLRNDVDFEARGSAYGNHYSAAITNTSLTSSSGADIITISGSEINWSFDGPAAADIKDDSDDVVLANLLIKAESEDVTIDTFPVTLVMGIASTTANPDNCEMVDDTNNVSFSVSDPTTPATSHTLNFENLTLEQGIQYNFEIRCDIPTPVYASETYQVTIAASGISGDTYVQSDAAVSASDYSAATLTGKTFTVAAPSVTLAKVTTNDTTQVENADGILLFKGKLTATDVDNIAVKRLKFDATVGGASALNLDSDLEKVYLYQVNSDGSETQLDTETSLAATTVTFSGFTMTVPKGASNGVYVVVRGDVKDSPTATTTKLQFNQTSTSHSLKDSDNNDVTASFSGTFGGIITVASAGTYTIDMDTDTNGLNANQNVLAGTSVLVGRLKLTAQKENALLNDLIIANTPGTATSTSADVAHLKLYTDKEMTSMITNGSADLDANNRAVFQDLDFEIPTVGVTYLYIGADIKTIDYSNSPGADSTASAEKKIQLSVYDDDSSYDTKATGKSTGEALTGTNETVGTTTTNTSTVLGAVVSSVTTDFANATLANGTKKIFSFKVTAPSSSNLDYDGTALGVQLASTTFTVAGITGALGYSSFQVERVGGANGKVPAKVEGGAATSLVASSSFGVNFITTYGSNSDLIIRPGETAEYNIWATVAGASTNQSVQVTIDSLASNLDYTHNYATTGGTLAGTVTKVYTLLPGVSDISEGGTLSN